jgi:hypothetical protein
MLYVLQRRLTPEGLSELKSSSHEPGWPAKHGM